MKKVMLLLSVMLLLLAAGTALAASPVGQWNVSFYQEPNLAYSATQGICFEADGTWYSSTFSGWGGDWFKKGDRIRFYGTTGTLSTAEFGQFSGNTRFTGEFAHFSETTGTTSTRGNFMAVKASATCAAPASQSSSSLSADPAQ